MIESILSLIETALLFIGLTLCIAVSDKYRSDRNVFRDKWLDAVDEYNSHLRNENYDLKNELDDLKMKNREDKNDDDV